MSFTITSSVLYEREERELQRTPEPVDQEQIKYMELMEEMQEMNLAWAIAYVTSR